MEIQFHVLLASAAGGGEWLGAHPEEECSEPSVQKTHRTQNRFRCVCVGGGGGDLFPFLKSKLCYAASHFTDLCYIFNLLSFLKKGGGGNLLAVCVFCVSPTLYFSNH
jgi:hypothetical protein